MNAVTVAGPDSLSVSKLLANDPVWLMLIKAVIIFALLLVMALFAIWFERRLLGKMQHRPGPNMHGPFGLLQSVADAFSLLFKEGIMPRMVDKVVYVAAPIMCATPALLVFSIIPLGGRVDMFGHDTALQLADLPVGVLVALVMSSIGIYGFALAGWSSGSTYPLLGGLRASAQLISYEVAMALAFVTVFLYSGTLSTSAIVAQQESGWYIWLLPVSFIVYVVSIVGETNRTPLDLPEAESELVGGYNTEYSSMRFGLFYLAEYINMINASALATTLFLGGWRAPWPLSLWSGANTGYWTLLWFFIKLILCMAGFIWLAAALPRLRYDQFMHMGWKVLVPVSLAWIVLVGVARVLSTATDLSTTQVLLWMGIPLVIILLIIAFWPAREKPEHAEDRDADEVAAEQVTSPLAPSAPSRPPVVGPSLQDFPVPPMDLVVPTPPRPRVPAGTAPPPADDDASTDGTENGGGDHVDS